MGVPPSWLMHNSPQPPSGSTLGLLHSPELQVVPTGQSRSIWHGGMHARPVGRFAHWSPVGQVPGPVQPRRQKNWLPAVGTGWQALPVGHVWQPEPQPELHRRTPERWSTRRQVWPKPQVTSSVHRSPGCVWLLMGTHRPSQVRHAKLHGWPGSQLSPFASQRGAQTPPFTVAAQV
jgi:hypothetical protein